MAVQGLDAFWDDLVCKVVCGCQLEFLQISGFSIVGSPQSLKLLHVQTCRSPSSSIMQGGATCGRNRVVI